MKHVLRVASRSDGVHGQPDGCQCQQLSTGPVGAAGIGASGGEGGTVGGSGGRGDGGSRHTRQSRQSANVAHLTLHGCVWVLHHSPQGESGGSAGGGGGRVGGIAGGDGGIAGGDGGIAGGDGGITGGDGGVLGGTSCCEAGDRWSNNGGNTDGGRGPASSRPDGMPEARASRSAATTKMAAALGADRSADVKRSCLQPPSLCMRRSLSCSSPSVPFVASDGAAGSAASSTPIALA